MRRNWKQFDNEVKAGPRILHACSVGSNETALLNFAYELLYRAIISFTLYFKMEDFLDIKVKLNTSSIVRKYYVY